MRLRTAAALLAIASTLHGREALAQTNSNTSTQNLFRVSFAASCLAVDSTRGRVVTTRFTDRNIIAQATGVSPSNRAINRDFALVFNIDQDSLQVVDAQGTPVVDVVHFGGGSATGDARQLGRFTFMFFPGQTNEFGAETNVFGTALITERARANTGSAGATRANITGRLQFVLASGTPLGTTNLAFGSGTNAQICTGIFTASRRFTVSATGTGATTGINGTNGSVNGTNGTVGTTSTNGTVVSANNTTVTGVATPVIIVTTPGPTISTPTSGGTTTTTLGSTTGMLPSLTANGVLPGFGTSIGTGLVSLTPFTPITTIGFGAPISTTGIGTTTTPTGSVTATTLSPGIAGTVTTPVGTTGLNGTTTGVSLPSTGSTTGF